jgi:hypothetical protein
MMTLNREKVFRTLTTLDTFVDRALKLEPKGPSLSGFHFTRDLLQAAASNTYLETVGKRADSIHLAIKDVPSSEVYWEYSKTVRIVGRRFNLSGQDGVLAVDYTDEEFYGDVEGFWIHGWTGEAGVTGKFKFLTCALVSSDIPQRIPLFSIPVHVGQNMAWNAVFSLSIVRSMVHSVKLVLFDRGFYSKELIMSLTDAEYPYLIFVPRNRKVEAELAQMAEGERKTIRYRFELNKDHTILRGETTLAFLRKAIDPTNGKTFDWAFATNQDEINLDYIVPTYKGRWRIETGFRVQDEARIKSKSKEIRVRFFFFVYEQLLQLLWTVLYKDEVTFKQFLLELSETCDSRLEKAEREEDHESQPTGTRHL